jgi:dipeptidyl-peptidase 4
MRSGHRWLILSTYFIPVFFGTVTWPTVASAQDAPAAAMLRRIFATPEFNGQRFGPARWLSDGHAYTTVEVSPSGGQDIVRYDAAAGTRQVLVSARQLTPAGGQPLGIEDYAWSGDGNRLLVFTNSERVWRDNTRGDYWVLDRSTGTLRRLGGNAPASTLMFAKFSPDGSRVGYVREGDLYVESVVDGSIVRLTTDGSRSRVNGTTDWVYEEEFGLRDAFRWSPDGNRIAYWQFDMTGVRDFLLINDTDSLYSFTIPVQYPKAGTTNSAVRAGIVPANGGTTTWIDLTGDPRNDYLPRMEWTGPDELLLQRINRLQNTNRVMLASAKDGSTRTLFVDRDSAWLDVVDDVTWLDGATKFLWVSERDGWRHLYSVARSDGRLTLLTPGEYDVIGVLAAAPKSGVIWFLASPENATQRYLYRVPLNGGPATRVTPATQPGTHGYDIAPDGRFAIHTYSTIDRPQITDLIRLQDHRVVRTLVDNGPLRTAAESVTGSGTEFFRLDIGGGVQLDGWMMKPRDFDPSRKYPLLMHVYSEPAGQTVLDRWGGGRMLWHHMLADMGYVVASVDNRGTPSPRGRAWRKIVYGSIGVLASREQAEAVRALVREHPWLDASRVGVWGWSGGGSATLNAMFRYPDVYQVGMSVAPVPDQGLYDTVYQERYMGLPQDNVTGYREGSPINFAQGLRGSLLLVHGSGDDNVHYQGSERLVNRMIQLGKRFDFMTYPNRSHCICEGEGTTLHIYTLLTRYLLEHLPAGPR